MKILSNSAPAEANMTSLAEVVITANIISYHIITYLLWRRSTGAQ